MSETERRFSYLVEDYFRERGTYPITITRRRSTTDETLEELQNTLFATYNDLTGVDVIDTQILNGDYWSGVLIELSGKKYIEMQNDRPVGASHAMNPARRIHREFATNDREEIYGFSCGDDAYATSALEALGRDFFRQ